jgi:DNA mismatch repair ATPase MutS
MTQLRHAIEELESFRYVVEKLQMESAPARRYLMALPWMTSCDQIESELAQAELAIGWIERDRQSVSEVSLRLSQLRDLKGTLQHLKSGLTLNDIELFELKHFWLLTTEVSGILAKAETKLISLPDTAPVLQLLDPEATGAVSFYIYDRYDPELASLRHASAKARRAGELDREEQLKDAALQREQQVRHRLSEQLQTYWHELQSAMDSLVYLDIQLAKAQLFKELGFVKPGILPSGETQLQGIFNPQVRDLLEAKGQRYQPVSLTFGGSPSLVTGANMAGKTVLLKTVALVQMLTQFGFYVPANRAMIVPVDRVMLSIGDQQSEAQGLSSYGAEMLRINGIVQAARNGQCVLALLDEPARTTNPTEGLALVKAIAALFAEMQVRSIITTHYGGAAFRCRKLRVRGFRESSVPDNIRVEDLGQYLDYDLEEDQSDSLPHEALRIAEILHVDAHLLAFARKFLSE